MAKTAKAATVIKKKRWVNILAPKLFNEQIIGETYISDVSEALGKAVSISLMALTGDPQRQTIALSFTMTGTNNNTLVTQPVGYRIVPAAVRKTMRRGKEKIEDSFELTTQDNTQVIIKPLLMTKNRTTGAVLTNLRKTAKANLTKMVNGTTFENLLLELVNHRLQRTLSDSLKKIYPLSTCEIKYFSRVQQTKTLPVAEQPPVKTEQPPAVVA